MWKREIRQLLYLVEKQRGSVSHKPFEQLKRRRSRRLCCLFVMFSSSLVGFFLTSLLCSQFSHLPEHVEWGFLQVQSGFSTAQCTTRRMLLDRNGGIIDEAHATPSLKHIYRNIWFIWTQGMNTTGNKLRGEPVKETESKTESSPHLF